jgi:type I restriction enzyme S subunit
MSEWNEYKLGNLIQSVSKTYKFTSEKVCFLNTSDTLEGKVINHNFFEPNDLPGQAKKSIEFNDILYSEIRPANKRYAFVDFNAEKYVVSTKLMVLRIINRKVITPRYLYYFLTSEEVVQFLQMLAESRSGTFPQIRFEEVSHLDIKLPPIEIQNNIVELISSLDKKIELNNKINQELETLAQLLFKRWFIDFEFPNENGEPYKSSGGEMIDSELGEIPKEFGLVRIGDLKYKLETGTRPKGGVSGITSGVPSVGAESVKGLGKYDYSKIKFVSEDFASKMKRGSVKGYELLIYKDGGKPGTFIPHFTIFGEGYPFDRFFINEHVFLLDFFDKEFNSFSYFFFDSLYVKPILENNGGKAAIPGINQEDIKTLRIFNPENALVKNYGIFAKSIIQTILLNCKENLQLANLRDTLLPKLISGELQINDK